MAVPPPEPGDRLSAAVLARIRDALKDTYLVERELGEGGAATVYLARDIKHERNVAIKVFKPELAETLGAERFTREIRTAANLQHPHILTVHDSGVADGLLYYVMPYVEGESLRARITREGGLPIGDVIRILREVADALHTAHRNGVVHRDIKPDNVLLSGRHALVADFGVAKAISESTGRNAITTLGVALGTPAYMAPEQAAADPHVDHRADIYALGVMGYEMLTGEPPFVRRTPQEVLAAHVTEVPPAVSVRRQSVPPALNALIAKCLLKQPGDRYQSAEEVVSELERIATPTGGMSPAMGMTPAAGVPPTGQTRVRVNASRNQNRLVTGLTIVAMLALAVSAWYAAKAIRGGSGPDSNVVAVLPFEYSGGPDHAYLKEGIVNVLEANLTGEAGPRAVASQTIIAQWKRRGGADQGLTEEEARTLAREVGAGQILRGSIVAAGADLVVSATLVSSSESGGQPVQAQVKGPADSIAVLATRLAGQLLSLRAGESADRLSQLQAVPAAALRAYLVGQQQMRESRFLDAHQSFSTALGLDSTFALAAMGLNTAQSWSPINLGAANGLAIAYRHRDKLGPRDSIVLHMSTPATFAGHPLSLREVSDLRERLVQQVPDRPEGWYLIADNYFHRGVAMGLSRDEAFRRAENGFRRVLALDPDLSYVKLHLAQMNQGGASIERMKHVADSIGLKAPEVDLTVQIMGGDSTDISRYRDRFNQMNADELMMVAFFTGGTPVGDNAYDVALSRSTSSAQRVNIMVGMRAALWSQGRPDKARREHDRLAGLGSDPLAIDPTGIVLAALFDDGDSTLASEAAGQLARARAIGTGQSRAPTLADRVPVFVIGLWAARVNDRDLVQAALARLDATAGRRDSLQWAATAKLYADAVRLVSTPGQPDPAAVEAFDAAMRVGPSIVGGPEFRSALNAISALSWERLRDPRRGAAAAERAATWDVTAYVQGTVQRDLGRLKLAAGDTAGAIRVWKDYLFIRGRAEPGPRKIDDEIRAKLAELERVKR
ncbi:MAG: protein kinase [Gemmatimonadetes bacterium]|nr:protein kinase [Gemmatimonadota bacterium]